MASSKITKLVCEEVHEYKWEIKNWELVQLDETLVQDQKFDIGTGHKLSLLSKITVGLEVSAADGNGERFIGVYCKLIELTGSKSELPVSFGVQVEKPKGGFFYQPAAISKSMKVGDTCNHPNAFAFNKPTNPASVDYLADDGTLPICIRLRVLNPMSTPQSVTSSMQTFEIKSTGLMQANYKKLLDGNSANSSDVTIISSDKRKFFCHKLILTARSPTFANTHLSELSGKNKGPINIDDLSGKTLEVFLNYLYTGQLLDNWSHPDVIVEFTKAAGKYKLTEVLEMMDNQLGSTTEKTTGTSFLLLKLANQLLLPEAEAKLMERIVNFTINAKDSGQLMRLMESEDQNKSVLPESPDLTASKTLPEQPSNEEQLPVNETTTENA